MSKIDDNQVQTIISTLQGTCDTLDGAVQEVCGDDFSEDDLTLEQLGEIDQQIFLCVDCGWWCEISEMSDIEDENVCDDCKEVR